MIRRTCDNSNREKPARVAAGTDAMGQRIPAGDARAVPKRRPAAVAALSNEVGAPLDKFEGEIKRGFLRRGNSCTI